MSEITLDDYKKSLKAGKYGSLAGARRGAGKIQGWDADTREKAKQAAEAFFASGNPPVKQEAPASTPKRGPGRPPGSGKKPASAEASSKPAAKPAAKKPAPATKPVAHAAPKAQAPRAPRQVTGNHDRQVEELTSAVGTISDALKAIKDFQTHVGPGELRSEALTAGRVLGAAVQALGHLVVYPVLPEDQRAAALAALDEKPARRAGKRTTEVAEATEGQTPPPSSNGIGTHTPEPAGESVAPTA